MNAGGCVYEVPKQSLKHELRAAWSVALYNLRVVYRYPANIIYTIAFPFLFLLVGLVFNRILSVETFAALAGGETALPRYVLSGLAVWLLSSASTGVGSSIEIEIMAGTLDANFRTPVSRTLIVAGFALSSLLYAGVMSVIVFAVLIPAYGITLSWDMALRLTLGLLVFFGMGLLTAAAALLWRRVGGILQTLSFVEQFLAGVFIPVRLLPAGLRVVSYLLPGTWVIDSVRSWMYNLTPLVSPEIETLILVTLAFLTNALGVGLLAAADRRVRLSGLADQY